MKFIKALNEKKWLQYTFATCSAVILYMILSHVAPVLGFIGVAYGYIKPIVYAIVIAYIINPVCNWFEKNIFYKMNSKLWAHNLSVVVAIIVILLVITLLVVALVPQLIDSIMTIGSNLDTYMRSLSKLIDDISHFGIMKNFDLSAFENMSDNIVGTVSDWLFDNYKNIFTASLSAGIGAFNLILGFILAIYFLLDKRRMINGLKRFFKAILTPTRYPKVMGFFRKCDSIMIRFIVCDIIDACIVGIVNGIFLTIAGYPYAVLISFICGITNMAPTFGPIVGGVIGAVLLVLINPIYAVVFVIATIVIQLLDGYVLKPKLFGAQLGVPAVMILISIVIGGNMFGVVGILLAIPFAAIFMVIYDDILNWLSRVVQDE